MRLVVMAHLSRVSEALQCFAATAMQSAIGSTKRARCGALRAKTRLTTYCGIVYKGASASAMLGTEAIITQSIEREEIKTTSQPRTKEGYKVL